jgi:hypothetical protein
VTPVTKETDYGRNGALFGGNVLIWLTNGLINCINVNVIAFMKENDEILSWKIDSLREGNSTICTLPGREEYRNNTD